MLYDLNVPWSSTQSPQELQRTISFLSELGYNVLALNHIISGPLPAQITNPIPETQSFSIPPKVTLLRRCTLIISDPNLNYRLQAVAAAYDILALRPTTEKAFMSACLSIPDHSIISLDMTQRHPFPFRPKPFMTAVNRGVRFEISYAQATLEDTVSRRNFISNCLSIIRATKGRGLIISSEARSALAVRGSHDVINLMAVWGLGTERGTQALELNPRAVVVNEGLKRTSYKGVVNVVDGGVREVSNEEAADGMKNKKADGKRKLDGSQQSGDGTPPISKRQAKKQRLEALKAAKGTGSPNRDARDKSGASTPMDTDTSNG
ncbi:RNase P subunit p30-domain-containing protein [Xylogone sp. PMI_703]|nr:RNase P subunit p30-domain-containing protein [Xylogone sp. PMI_703]